jgi:hypothetical protein
MKPETKNELAAMLDAAEKKIGVAEKEMARIRAEHEKAKVEATYLRGVLSINDNVSAPEPPTKVEMQRPVKFRDVIREAVEAAHGPIPISDVTDHLKAKGFSEEGATPLAVRVGNELFRLANLGEIKRASRGHYESTK